MARIQLVLKYIYTTAFVLSFLSFYFDYALAEDRKGIAAAGTPGVSFLATNPEIGYIIIIGLFGLVVFLIKDRDKLKDKAYTGAVASLAKDQNDFFKTFEEALDKLELKIGNLDSKFERTMVEAFRKIDTNANELAFLKGEHKARKGYCFTTQEEK